MRIITIVLPDDEDPPCVYIGDLDPAVAAMALWHAFEAIEEEVVGMTVDRTSAADL